MIVINFFAGPGAGKSTTAHYLFARFKNKGLKVEMAREFAKDLIFEGRQVQLERNQFLVSASQYARLKDLEHSGCEIAITDSPLLLGLAYSKNVPYYPELEALIKKVNSEFNNINVYIERVKPYATFGRLQTASEAKAIDEVTYPLGYPYHAVVAGDERGQEDLVQRLLRLPSMRGFDGREEATTPREYTTTILKN